MKEKHLCFISLQQYGAVDSSYFISPFSKALLATVLKNSVPGLFFGKLCDE